MNLSVLILLFGLGNNQAPVFDICVIHIDTPFSAYVLLYQMEALLAQSIIQAELCILKRTGTAEVRPHKGDPLVLLS